jgi:hypothetical protein
MRRNVISAGDHIQLYRGCSRDRAGDERQLLRERIISAANRLLIGTRGGLRR